MTDQTGTTLEAKSQPPTPTPTPEPQDIPATDSGVEDSSRLLNDPAVIRRRAISDLLFFCKCNDLDTVKEIVNTHNLDLADSANCCDYDQRTPLYVWMLWWWMCMDGVVEHVLHDVEGVCVMWQDVWGRAPQPVHNNSNTTAVLSITLVCTWKYHTCVHDTGILQQRVVHTKYQNGCWRIMWM